MDEGNWSAAGALNDLVSKTTQAALSARKYMKSSTEVALPHRVKVEWFAFESVEAPEPDDSFSPPVVCTAMGPLEVLTALASKHTSNPMVMTFELTDFSSTGSVSGLESRSAAQRELMQRTNVEAHIRQAEVEVAGGANSSAEHLCAAADPYIMVAHNVRVFRGPGKEGYPFLPLAASSNVTMLLSGRHSARPELSKKGEYFIKEEDVIACMDRLHLFALATLSCTDSCVGPPSWAGEAPKGKPILIIAMHDLTAVAAQQPRHSIAAALKCWRKTFAHLFEVVMIACGDAQTAEIVDQQVNGDVYTAVLKSTWGDAGWHWDPAYMDLSATPMLPRLGQSVQAGRNFGLLHALGDRSLPSSRAPSAGTRRRSTVGELRMSQRQQVLQVVEHDMQDSAVSTPTTVWHQAREERRKSQVEKRNSGVAFSNLPDTPSSAASMSSGGGTRRRSALPGAEADMKDSRSVFERAYQQRIAGLTIRERSGLDDEASEVNVTSTRNMQPEKSLSLLESRKKIDKNAEMLGLSASMKAALVRQRRDDSDDEEQQLQREEECRMDMDIQQLCSTFQSLQAKLLAATASPLSPRRHGIPSEALAEREELTPTQPSGPESSPGARPPKRFPIGVRPPPGGHGVHGAAAGVKKPLIV